MTTTQPTVRTARAIAGLTVTYRAARLACMAAFDAGRAATQYLPDDAAESDYAAARIAAGAPTVAEEVELHAAMVGARTALVRSLRRAGLAAVDASDAVIAQSFAGVLS